MASIPDGPFPPDCAERFRHVRQIGAGGFGAVHEAVQVGLERTVAVKLLLPDVLRDAVQVARFVNEARATAALSHPNVVRVVDHGAASGIPWIAYEFVEGRTLRAVLDASPAGVPLATAAEIAAQVGEALDASHALGILHRDVKPENVLEAGGGLYKVMDFGIAKWISGGVSTQAGMILGTPSYMSPEHASGAEMGPGSDLYALGVMLFELLCGRRPFADSSPLRLLEAHRRQPPPRVRELRPGLPQSVEPVMQRALEKSPGARWQSGAALAAALKSCLSGAPPITREMPAASGRTRRPSRSVAQVAPAQPPRAPHTARAAAIALAVVGIAAIALRNRGAEVPPPNTSATATLRASPSATPPRGPNATVRRAIDDLLAEADRIIVHAHLVPVGAVGIVSALDPEAARSLASLQDPAMAALERIVELFEVARDEGWDGPEWFDLDEILATVCECVERSHVTILVKPGLPELLRRAERAVRGPPRGRYDALVRRTTPLHLLYASSPLGGELAKHEAPLLQAEQQLAAAPTPDWMTLYTRLRLLRAYCRLLGRTRKGMGDYLEKIDRTKQITDAQRDARRTILELCRRLAGLASAAPRPRRRLDAGLRMAFFCAYDHAMVYKDQSAEVATALPVARLLAPLVPPDEASRSWCRLLAAVAAGAGQRSPCEEPAPSR